MYMYPNHRPIINKIPLIIVVANFFFMYKADLINTVIPKLKLRISRYKLPRISSVFLSASDKRHKLFQLSLTNYKSLNSEVSAGRQSEIINILPPMLPK